MRSQDAAVVLTITEQELDTLIDSVAAEVNHEPNRRRQQRLDATFDALTAAVEALSSMALPELDVARVQGVVHRPGARACPPPGRDRL